MQLPHFALSRFGAVNVVKRTPLQSEVLIGAYELEFYTEDSSGGTLTDGVFRQARKGWYCLYRPGQRQQLVPPYKCYFLNVFTQDPELCDFLDRLPPAGPVWDMEAVVELMREMMATPEKQSLTGRLWLQSCASRVLSLLIGQRPLGMPAEPGAFLHRDALMAVDRYIREHLSEDLSLNRLAELSRLDPTYFHKLYTSAYGKTPAQRVLTHRITAAKMAIAEGELSLNEIATRCGFSSQSYFTCKFKQATGLTPSGYRSYIQANLKK